MKLLIVDDSNMIRQAIDVWSSKLGLDVVGHAKNGVEAIELCHKLNPEIITLDITMPEMDGLEALGKIMAINSEIKVIIISALTSKEIAIEALNNGAETFLQKPFTEAELKETFEEVI